MGKMRFLFLLGALLVLFAEVAYPQGEDYQGKRGKHGFLQGKRGKHGFFQDKTNVRCTRNEDCGRNELNVPFCCSKLGKCDACKGLRHDSREDYQGKRGKHGFAFRKYYQGKRGKHGFLQGKRGKHGFIRDEEDPLIRVPLYRGTKDKLYGINMGVYDQNNYKKHKSPKCTTDSDCGDGECCRIMEHRIGLTAFATCGRCTLDNPDDDYQGKRGKHGFLQGKRGKHGIYFSGGLDYQGKRGKHGFFEKEDSQWPKSSSDYDCRPDCNICLHGMCDHCLGLKHDSGEDYQGKRGKHGFFSAGEDYQGIPLPCTVPKCYPPPG